MNDDLFNLKDNQYDWLKQSVLTNLKDYDYYFCFGNNYNDNTKKVTCYFSNNVVETTENKFSLSGYRYCNIDLNSYFPMQCGDDSSNSANLSWSSFSSGTSYRLTNFTTQEKYIDIVASSSSAELQFDNTYQIVGCVLLAIVIMILFLKSIFER